MWELRGCPFCRDTHVINFAKPEIVEFVKSRFDILQLNIIGAREVVDFDGEKLPEKRLAEKYGVRSTPTFQFFAERSAGLAVRKPIEREAVRAQGYLVPDEFLAMFRFVAERGYERELVRPPARQRPVIQCAGPLTRRHCDRRASRPSDRQKPLVCNSATVATPTAQT